MTVDRHRRAKEIFLAVCELPVEQRSPYLDEACEGDADLRREVESLLEIDQSEPSRAAEQRPPERIGNFRLLQKVGEGGMGEVWEAEQERPVRRRVAFKLIRWGMDTREVLARFESERQALALMNHPNIARALEAGSTDEGRPFFAMEYVKGIPVTEYADSRKLSTRERLRLFLEVCGGVQHAHQKGIIHRDIKPSNILVAYADGRPVPKIIDFGVAKATSQRLTERTLFTELGQWIGTPEYMSPEQAELTGLDVDTRSDVYSLGVVLYELLAGAQPFDSKELRTAGFDEMRRKIREDEPPKPSTRVSSLGAASQGAAERRRTDIQGLARTLRGDLDWIVMKALEKDRSRRYGSASELAADVGRYLASEPVDASPPGTIYRVQKFVRRHRAGVAAGAVMVVVLVAGVVGTAAGLVKARNEAEAARTVSELLVGVFADLDPSGQVAQITSTTSYLDRGVERIQNELSGQPVVQARVLDAAGTAYRGLGQFDRARPLLEQALRLRENHVGETDAAVADSRVSLGWLAYQTADYAEARDLFERAVSIYEQSLGPDHWAVAATLGAAGTTCWRAGDYDDAESFFGRALEIFEATGKENDPVVVSAIFPYALMLMDLAQHEAALPYLERARLLYEREFGPEYPAVGNVLFALGRCYHETLRHDEARPLYERALEIQERTLGPDHFTLMYPLTKLAMLDRRDRNLETAREKYERALRVGERALGANHPDLAWTLGPYAVLLLDQGEEEAARANLDRALHVVEGAYGSTHLDVARAIEMFGFHYYKKRDYDEALRWYERALGIREKVFGVADLANGWNLYDQACILALAGDADGSLAALHRALDCGWANYRIYEDDDLDSLRGDPAFESIVDEVRAKL